MLTTPHRPSAPVLIGAAQAIGLLAQGYALPDGMQVSATFTPADTLEVRAKQEWSRLGTRQWRMRLVEYGPACRIADEMGRFAAQQAGHSVTPVGRTTTADECLVAAENLTCWSEAITEVAQHLTSKGRVEEREILRALERMIDMPVYHQHCP